MVGKVKRLKKITDCLLSVAFYICILIIGWLVLQTTCFTTFTIPSDSMAPTLQAGDRILVNKWIMGARIFNIWDALEDKEVKIHRLPGVGKVKRNDVLYRPAGRYAGNKERILSDTWDRGRIGKYSRPKTHLRPDGKQFTGSGHGEFSVEQTVGMDDKGIRSPACPGRRAGGIIG